MTSQTRRPLFLYEELLLLALRDREGTIPACTGNLGLAMGGAILAELLLRERLRVVKEGKRERIRVSTGARAGEALLDEARRRVRDAKRPASPSTWVSRFSRTKGLRHRVAGDLCRLGILRSEERRVLMLFTRKVYPTRDTDPERELVERLREAIFGPGREVESRTVVLLSLANAADLLRRAFDKKQLKARKQHIKDLVEGDLAGRATKQAIEAVQAAVIAASAGAVVAGS